MKLLVCCLVILAVSGLGQCATSSEELMSMKLIMLKNYLRERQAMTGLTEKVEAICPGYGSRFEHAVVKVQQCTNDIDEDNETMCSTVKNHFERCAKPIVSLFEECLPERSKEVPSWITKSLLSATDYLCRTDGEHIFELYNPCLRTNSYRTQRCMRKIQSKLQQYSSKTPSKSEVCDFMSSFKGCLESHLHYSCGNSKTREAFLNVYDAALQPCQQSTVSLNEVEVMEPQRERTQWLRV